MEEQYEPLIIAFCCNWCSYAGADLAGVSRIQYPANGRIIRVMCSGMVHPNLVIGALTKAADRDTWAKVITWKVMKRPKAERKELS
jgi:F420-non-reducing hydrogenase iron-sulfur subunit